MKTNREEGRGKRRERRGRKGRREREIGGEEEGSRGREGEGEV